MKDLRNLNEFRHVQAELQISGQTGHPLAGVFELPSPIDRKLLRVIASAVVGDWDHVSISRKDRCPNWPEMCFIKDKFFDEEDCVMQIHPPKSEYINNHPYCLHLWMPLKQEIPRPPSSFVGV